MDKKNELLEAGEKLGVGNEVEGLILKKGCLRGATADEAKEVLGFEYIVYHENVCYRYYSANPPLTGMTQPKPVPYPLGLSVFYDYKIDYADAICLFHEGDWGGSFSEIELKMPLHPSVKEPCWYFMSNLGVQVIIGANSGKFYNA